MKLLWKVDLMLFVGLFIWNAATSVIGVVEAQESSAAWEEELVEAWRTIEDCSPETGMCDACGFGVAVVDLNGDPNNNGTAGGAATRTFTAGPSNLTAPWDADSTWEIASITKPFTAITALILEQEGVLTLDESTVADFLTTCDWESANSDIATVTLLELIQHMSGMPAQPPDRGPTIDGNPFANYTVDRLCASLLKLNGLPTRGRYSYSNYAYGLLGYLLTLAVGPADNPPDYEDVVKSKILMPLEMFNTSVTFDDAGWALAAEGCARSIARVDETIRLGAYETLQGNGALRSTLNDMAQYLRVALYVDAGMPALSNETSLLKFGPLPAPSEALTKVYRALSTALSLEHRTDLACACVSDWCEGLLCPLPNPNDEFITPGGFEGYHSGGLFGGAKVETRVRKLAAEHRRFFVHIRLDSCDFLVFFLNPLLT